MLGTFASIFRITELRNKILITLGLLVVYRVGGHIPTPGVDGSIISAAVSVDPIPVPSGVSMDMPVTVVGAAVGDAVVANPGVDLTGGLTIAFVRVTGADTVRIGFFNAGQTTQNLVPSTWEFRIIK